MICWVVLTEAARTGPRVGGRRVDVRVEIEDVDPQTRAEDDTRAERAIAEACRMSERRIEYTWVFGIYGG